MKNFDLHYLCTNLGNLSGMPVRLYEGDEQVFYYSAIHIPTEPYEVYWPDVKAITDHVGYLYTPYHSYFGVLNFGSGRIVLGPNRQMAYTEQELRQMAFDLDVPIAEVPAFVDGLKKLQPKPLTLVLQMLCTLNHLLNEGETLSLMDVAIVDVEQKRLVEAVGKEEASRTLDEADGIGERWMHNTMEIEEYMLSLVQKGDVAGLNAFFANVPAIQSGQMAPDSLRQVKNLFVVTATLVSRAAIRGGMDPNEALTLSDLYIQQCEPATDLDYVTNLNYRLVMDYTERMQSLRYGNSPSKLIIEVNNYVRHHLSEPITVEDLAKFLCRGRSRLSTDFKKETGENLSEFILKQKIEEGKKLLRYTDKPSVEIALYLGFSSQSHFSRTFKKYVGLTPNEYRRKKAERRNQ